MASKQWPPRAVWIVYYPESIDGNTGEWFRSREHAREWCRDERKQYPTHRPQIFRASVTP